MKNNFFLKKSVLLYRRFGHLSDHYQYNKLSRLKRNITKYYKWKIINICILYADLKCRRN
jgi:hypothetical protein